MTRNERHVVKNPKSGWDVKKPHAERVSCHTDTKAEAIERAREICLNQGAECVIHGIGGEIQNSNSYGKDPYPPKDKRN
jgi:hypothetical protein